MTALANLPDSRNQQILVGARVVDPEEPPDVIYSGQYMASGPNQFLPFFAVSHVTNMRIVLRFVDSFLAGKYPEFREFPKDANGEDLPNLSVTFGTLSLINMLPDDVVPLITEPDGLVPMFIFAGRPDWPVTLHAMEAAEAEVLRDQIGRPPMFVLDSPSSLRFISEGEAMP